ncbi:hypothetical protein OPHB3_3428 [Oceanobacillus picturae]|uniref:DUF2971 domain-containing protein n=1 Tax=Oceanobacillus picturae TaxID=171693 RepID=A0A0U9H9W6_9BACI|nr:hypothetical protein [Oceanobacillus picturae]GAQ19459.1 hypothetical protein OPHB3_3428 [Oceanobacillus picturae]
MVEYLYHYTNLETLKLILHNKTIRLSSLNKMDDLEEGDTEDFKKLGRFIYISSWTNNSAESLLLWGYSRGNDGVRLRMKSNIFKTTHIDGNVYIHGHYASIKEDFNIGLLDLMKNENVVFVPPRAELVRVTYTDLNRLLKPTVYKRYPNGNFALKTKDLGIFKKVEWQDQQEWRYRLSSMPINVNEMSLLNNPNNYDTLLKKIKTREELPFIDLPLKDSALDDLEILCGPKMSVQSKDDLKKVLKKYAPNTTVRDSGMRIRG